MYPGRFEHLLAMLALFISKHDTRFRKCISVRERLALNLQFFATGDAQQIYLLLYIPFYMKCNFFCNFTPCISVHVIFLVRNFAFVVKTKSLFVPLIFLPLERDFLTEIFPKVYQTKPESEFSSHKVLFMFCFCIILLLGVLSCPQVSFMLKLSPS